MVTSILICGLAYYELHGGGVSYGEEPPAESRPEHTSVNLESRDRALGLNLPQKSRSGPGFVGISSFQESVEMRTLQSSAENWPLHALAEHVFQAPSQGGKAELLAPSQHERPVVSTLLEQTQGGFLSSDAGYHGGQAGTPLE